MIWFFKNHLEALFPIWTITRDFHFKNLPHDMSIKPISLVRKFETEGITLDLLSKLFSIFLIELMIDLRRYYQAYKNSVRRFVYSSLGIT